MAVAISSYLVEKININATVEENTATLSGTGEKQLAVGNNKFDIVVVAEDKTKRTYTVNVVRKEADDDTSLSKVIAID